MLSIIIPTYNEAKNLKEFVEVLRQTLSRFEYEIIIVDDSSPDGTGKLADSLKQSYANIRVLHRFKKMGSGSAIIDGTRIAIGDIIATLNSDFQYPAEYLLTMIKQINEFDIVIGSRYVTGGGTQEWSWWRAIISRTATFLAHILIPKSRQIKDPLSSFFVLKRTVINNAVIKPVGFKCLLEVLVKGSYDRVIEIPYIFQKRKAGKSKTSFMDCFIYLYHLFRLMRNVNASPVSGKID